MNSTAFHLPLGGQLSASVVATAERSGYIQVSGFDHVAYQETDHGTELLNLPEGWPVQALLAVFGSTFARQRKCQQVTVVVPAGLGWAVQAVRSGVAEHLQAMGPGKVALRCLRQGFWQHPQPWLVAPGSGQTPLAYTFSDGKRHPRRPPLPQGEVYARYLPGLASTFSLRTVDIDRDLPLFNRWMNLDAVAYFWEQAGTLDEHAQYLAQLFADPRVHPLMGCFDGEAFAYFEVYWCKEDRIAPYYDVADYDRGWHVVIGEQKHQGIGKLRGWFNSLMHYMFIDDARTQRIMGEPRIDHTRQIDFLKSQGYGHLKNIQLPHKQAALLRLERETFFDNAAF